MKNKKKNFVETLDVPTGKYRITIAELRKCKGFESISDEKAEEVIDTLVRLSALCYRSLRGQEDKNELVENNWIWILPMRSSAAQPSALSNSLKKDFLEIIDFWREQPSLNYSL